MPNTKSAKKRLRQNLKRRMRNKFYRSRARNFMKRIRKLLEAGDVDQARSLLPQAFSAIDKAAKVGVFHPNTAARYKSKLAIRVQRAVS